MEKTFFLKIKDARFIFSKRKDLENWIKAGKLIEFQFSPEYSDDKGVSIFGSLPRTAIFFELTESNSIVRTFVDGLEVNLKAWVSFKMILKKDVTCSQIENWAFNLSGDSCFSFSLIGYDDVHMSEHGGVDFSWEN